MIEWLNVIAGLILCVGFLEAVPFMGKYLEKFAKWLGTFDTIIGIIIIIYVIWAAEWNLQGYCCNNCRFHHDCRNFTRYTWHRKIFRKIS